MASISLMELVVAGILLVVLGFALTIGQDITAQNAQQTCTSVLGRTWVTNLSDTTNSSALMRVNPLDNSYSGCCTTLNTSFMPSHNGYCLTWTTNSYALNSSYYGMQANNTLSYWIPIIALAIAAGFVIAILITYLLGSVTGKTSASI